MIEKQTTTRTFKPRHRGDQRHATGAIIHWDERDPADPYNYVAITCCSCKLKKYAPKSSVNNAWWRGLCGDCSHALPPRTMTGDWVSPSGAIIHYDERDPNDSGRAVVTCCTPGCNTKEMMRVNSGNRNTQKFYCKSCRSEQRRVALSAAWHGARGKEKHSRGRKKSSTLFDRSAFLADLKKIVLKLWGKYGSTNEITLERAAEKLNLIGHTIGGPAVKARLKTCGITQRWPAYVESLVFGKPKIKSSN